jgi:hypothetical protein
MGGKCSTLVEISGQQKLHVWSWHTRLIILMWILEKYDNDWIDLAQCQAFVLKNESSDSVKSGNSYLPMP